MKLRNPNGKLDYLVKKKVSPEVEGTSQQVAVLEECPGTPHPQEYEEIILHPSYHGKKVKIG